MSDEEIGRPFHVARGDGSTFEVNPNNSALYLHVGGLAVYNHAFIIFDKEQSVGGYVFQIEEAWPHISRIMVEREYPIHMNLRSVEQCDVRAYLQTVDKLAEGMVGDIGDGVPEGWS